MNPCSGISTEQLIESLRNARASVKILLLTSALSAQPKPLVKAAAGERCLTSTPLSKRRPTAPSARIHAQTIQMPKPNNARTMLPLAHKLTYDAPRCRAEQTILRWRTALIRRLACHRLPRHLIIRGNHVGHHESQGLLRIHSQRNLTVPFGIQFA